MKSAPLVRKANVLAVDDTPANLIALEAVLAHDYNLIEAHSGAEALEILKKRQDIDVILMDVQMPEMDGYETATLIKKMSHCTDVPIVFVTAVYKEEAFVRKGYQAGGVDYFGKPFDPDILRMKLAIYSSFRMKADMLKAKEQQLRETEELLQAGRKLASVLEGLPVGVIIADMSGRICQTNGNVARICKALDPSGDQSYGKILGWWDEEGQIIKEKGGPLARALESGQTSHNEILKISCDEDSEKTLLCSASPLHGFDGHPVGAVVVLQDVTESKKIEEDLEQRIARFISLGVELQHSSTH